MDDERLRARAYTREFGDDAPDVRDWTWPGAPTGARLARGLARRVRILVVNAGSSSVKLSLVGDGDETLAERELEAPRAQLDPEELREALRDGLGGADAVGHRIVHGGERFREPVRIDADVDAALRELVDLAPLHQPKSLAALDAVAAALPDVPAVACFDTAFHATLPPAAYTYALPARWRERWALRRYGFHGLSHAWVARRAPELLGMPPDALRIVSCHLGAGASLCAIARRPLGRHDDGLHAARGAGDGHPLGQRRPGAAAVAARAREADRAASSATRSSTSPGCSGWPAAADMREVLDARGRRRRPARARRSTSTSTACAPGSPRWRRRSAGSTCSSSPAASASTPPRSARAPPRDLGSSAWRSTTGATPRAEVRPTSPAAARRSGRLVIPAREDLEIAGQTRKRAGSELSSLRLGALLAGPSAV